MIENGLFPILQSSYRKHHSTETSLLKVENDILLNTNKQHVTLLVLLDLSAAFDTVSHTILNEVLGKLGFGGKVLEWFRSYQSGRAQRVFVRGCQSDRLELSIGVSQRSCCLGPSSFPFMRALY